MTLNLNKYNHKDPDNISVTAYRIISIFNMLLEAPCDDEEINERLQQDILGARSLSKDTFYIYINTLRAIGCVISRPSMVNNYKYVLKSHPFNLILNDEEINALVEIRKYIATLDDWKLLVNVDRLYNNIIENLEAEEKKKFTQSIKSCLRDIEVNHQAELINVLEKYCSKNRTLMINYMSPDSGEKTMEMIVDKLTYENGAFYLWGYNTEQDDTQYIRVDRIKEINAVNIKNNQYIPKIYCVNYKLTGIHSFMFTPDENEIIIEKNDNYVIIEAKIQSKFKFIQRILSYGNDCIVISPDIIRKEVISKLKLILNSYKQINVC